MKNEKEIRDFIAAIEPEIEVYFNDEEPTYFDSEDNFINLGYDFHAGSEDCGFRAHIVRKHGFPAAFDYPIEVWSILHELGHFMTIDDVELTEEEVLARMICKDKTVEEVAASIELQDLYFDLPLEWEATEWAIDFITTNPEAVNYLVGLVE